MADVADDMTLTAPAAGSQEDLKRSLGFSVPDRSADVESRIKAGEAANKKLLAEEDTQNAKRDELVKTQKQKEDDAWREVTPFKPQAGPKQQDFQTDPIKTFFSLGSVVGILASAFTHQPWTASIDAATAAINARNASDAEGYKTAFAAWKENNALLKDRHQLQMEDWKAIVERNKNDMTNFEAEARAHLARIGDEAGTQFFAAGQYEKLWDLQQKRQDSMMAMQEHALRVEEMGAKIGAQLYIAQATKDYEKAYRANDQAGMTSAMKHAQNIQSMQSAKGGSSNTLAGIKVAGIENAVDEFVLQKQRQPTPDEFNALVKKTLTDQGSGRDSRDTVGFSPAAIDLAANIALQTGQSPSLGMGGKADREAINNRMAELAKERGLSVADILSGRSSFKADTSSLTKLQAVADSSAAFEKTVLKNMEIAESLMLKGQGTEAGPVLNRWIQAGRKATGDPDVKALDDSIQTVANEYAKIMSGATGAQAATEGARNEANAMVNSIDSPAAIHKVFDAVMRPDMQNRIGSYGEQIASIKGRIGGVKPDGSNKSHRLGDIIEHGGKRYRVIGGDPNDPDVEEVK